MAGLIKSTPFCWKSAFLDPLPRNARSAWKKKPFTHFFGHACVHQYIWVAPPPPGAWTGLGSVNQLSCTDEAFYVRLWIDRCVECEIESSYYNSGGFSRVLIGQKFHDNIWLDERLCEVWHGRPAIRMTEHDWNQWSMTEISGAWLKSVEHDWNQWSMTEVSGAWLKLVEHDWNQWSMTEISGAWLKSVEHDKSVQWSMTEVSGAWLKSVEHDWSQWSMTEISGAWLKSVEHDWNQWSMTEISGAWLKSVKSVQWSMTEVSAWPGGATQIYRCTHACPWVLKIPPKQVSYFDEKKHPFTRILRGFSSKLTP